MKRVACFCPRWAFSHPLDSFAWWHGRSNLSPGAVECHRQVGNEKIGKMSLPPGLSDPERRIMVFNYFGGPPILPRKVSSAA